MRCHQAQDLFSPYIDGFIGVRQKLRLEKHLRDCPDCRLELDQLSALSAGLQALPMMPLPEDFMLELRPKLLAALPEIITEKPLPRRNFTKFFQPLAAAAVIVFCFFSLLNDNYQAFFPKTSESEANSSSTFARINVILNETPVKAFDRSLPEVSNQTFYTKTADAGANMIDDYYENGPEEIEPEVIAFEERSTRGAHVDTIDDVLHDIVAGSEEISSEPPLTPAYGQTSEADNLSITPSPPAPQPMLTFWERAAKPLLFSLLSLAIIYLLAQGYWAWRRKTA
ncbi:MAG: zf-HC2 domain-containing protein [Clostridiales bacterium]|jgi:hypothetical protein|nr:zf-HC2 domain-containing protein [Clostridiales bacterium]MDR2711712.1 zf-HC2 domain-containing protein [Clostridiales bacterium]